MSRSRGIGRAAQIYDDRDKRVRELRQDGRKVVGYLCYFAPPEIIEAAGLVPYRIRGNIREPIVHTDAYIEPDICPFVRNCFELQLGGKGDFLDGLVMAHSCDSVQRMYGIWTYNSKHSYSYLLNVPHTTATFSFDFFKRELGFFRESLSKFSGRDINDESLREVIGVYNRNRALVRELYELRKLDPPLLSGTEMLQVLVAGGSIPAEEFNTLLQEVLQEVNSRGERPKKQPARLLLYGCIMDDTTFIKLIEEAGSNVVVDDTCIGTRSHCFNVPATEDPLEGLAKSYFLDFQCPRTFRDAGVDRFTYITKLAKDFNVNGVIMYVLAHCDPHKFDIVPLRTFLSQSGLPSLLIDDDYTLANAQSIRTRVQAFIEMTS